MTAAAKGTISGKARMFVDDNGYADHKSAWLDEKGNIKTMKVPALIQSGSAGLAGETARFAVGTGSHPAR